MENTWPTTQQFRFYKSDSKVVEGTTLLHLRFFKAKLNNLSPPETRSYVTICRDALNPKPMSAVKSELSMNAPKEYSLLHAAQNWKRTPASTDGFAYHIEINMAKMGGIEPCLFPWGTSSIPTDGNRHFVSAYYVPDPGLGARDEPRGSPFAFSRQPYGWRMGASSLGRPLTASRGRVDYAAGRDIWVVSWRMKRKWDDSKRQPLVRCARSPVCALRIAGSLVRAELKAKRRAPTSFLSGKRSQSNVPLHAVGRLFFPFFLAHVVF